MNQQPSPIRCLVVAGTATGLLATLTAFLLPDLDAGLAVARGARPAPTSFEDVLVNGCAVVAVLAASWLWVVTCTIALLAARGRTEDATTRAPVVVRRLVLAACGVAMAGALSGPAGAAPVPPGADRHGTAGLGGLPLPDRATGRAPATSPVTRLAGLSRSRRATPVSFPIVVVRPGDTLWDLAAAHLSPGADPAEITACWHRIHELNRAVIGDDPDLIQPDQRLRLPRR